MCTISIISNIDYLLSGKFNIIFIKKVFRVTEYRFWYSIIGCSSEYPVNRVLVAIPNIYITLLNAQFYLEGLKAYTRTEYIQTTTQGVLPLNMGTSRKERMGK